MTIQVILITPQKNEYLRILTPGKILKSNSTVDYIRSVDCNIFIRPRKIYQGCLDSLV